eukprot:scaffold470_cov225-Prasinococcus_capsulatus_cf.AAC.2
MTVQPLLAWREDAVRQRKRGMCHVLWAFELSTLRTNTRTGRRCLLACMLTCKAARREARSAASSRLHSAASGQPRVLAPESVPPRAPTRRATSCGRSRARRTP